MLHAENLCKYQLYITDNQGWTRAILIPGVPKKEEHLIFVTLIFENIALKKKFHHIKHCILKRMIPRSLKLVE